MQVHKRFTLPGPLLYRRLARNPLTRQWCGSHPPRVHPRGPQRKFSAIFQIGSSSQRAIHTFGQRG
ncbi:hypothetical protein Hypma_013893 [Hypsizygus marmoreus]|uniref:Uncharacterized protein n=1 Tax=Hypsizygus marmoreus TaxID=39966 RepID=A0A369K8C4_HYPMA|nr:hypothetical protein Hypma_013893 [Hypsizygus marmoreus]